MKTILSQLDKGAVVWSGVNSRGNFPAILIYNPDATSGTKAEMKAYPYLRALGIPYTEGKEYPLRLVDSQVYHIIDNVKPLHPLVEEFYKLIDNPDNETAAYFLHSLSELEEIP